MSETVNTHQGYSEVSEVIMTDQAENELIAEKLLGWRKLAAATSEHPAVWHEQLTAHTGRGGMETPTFATWAEAGLILDLLMTHIGPGLPQLRTKLASMLEHRQLTPLAIRSAALAYLRAQP